MQTNTPNANWQPLWDAQHQQTFNVACAMPKPLVAEIYQEIVASRDKAASFDTLSTALRRIAKRTPASLPVSS